MDTFTGAEFVVLLPLPLKLSLKSHQITPFFVLKKVLVEKIIV